MFHLVYESEASHLFRDEDLSGILEVARARNSRDGITGVLIYHDRKFVQALEGPEDRVRTLFDRISRDPLHTDVCRLARMRVGRRIFSRWTMGLASTRDLPIRRDGTLRDFRTVVARVRELSARHPDGDAAYTARLLRHFLRQFRDVQNV